MTLTLRLILIAGSVLTFFWVVRRIRRAQVRIEDSIFWIGFSAVLILLSIFPGLIDWGASVTGVYSGVNFLFLAILFILIVKIFSMSVHISRLESRLSQLIQQYAIEHKDEKRE